MSAIPSSHLALDRAAINRANSLHSTGPRTDPGKQRSSLNAIRHGLTARTAVLPTEDPAAYENHCQQLRDEYQPATPTEALLVRELADTAWRLNRIPLLETRLISGTDDLPIVDAHRLLQNLGIQAHRLSRQFQKTLATLRDLQADRRHHERRQLKDAAALLELHKHKGISWHPSDHGFVFSKDQVERHSELLMRQNEARHIAYCRFELAPQLQPAVASTAAGQ